MASFYKPFLFIFIALSLFGFSYKWLSKQEYQIDKVSPNGIYRVKATFGTEKPKGTRQYTERVKVQYLKGEDIIDTYEDENSDQYEPSIRETMQVFEWVGNNTLRIGQDRSDQPFMDELIISNNTNENLKYLGISYGRFETFKVFDLAPRNQVVLGASPRFKPDGTSNYFLGYSGITQSGKSFSGTMEVKERKSPADGPLKFQISISGNDLR